MFILNNSKLIENNSLSVEFKTFIIEETKNQYGYNFNAIQTYVYEEYTNYKKDIEFIIMEER